MLTAAKPRRHACQSDQASLIEHVSRRLRPEPWTDRGAVYAVVDALGRSLAAATLPSAEREVIQRPLLNELLDAPPPISELSASRGLAAMGFVLQDIARSLVEPVDLEEVDALVLAATGRAWPHPVGLADGLAGMAVYGFARAPGTAARQIVESVILHLQTMAQLSIDGILWPTSGADLDGAPTVCLARGGAGILSVLLVAQRETFVPDVVLDLIEGHVPWILDHLGESAVVRWSEGSLGPITVVVRAGALLQRPDWTDRALAALGRLRPSLVEAPISQDPSLRRGNGGVLVLLQSLAHHVQLPWLQTALGRWQAAAESACLRVLETNAPIDWSLLDGIGGTLRALHDARAGLGAPWRMLVGAHEKGPQHDA